MNSVVAHLFRYRERKVFRIDQRAFQAFHNPSTGPFFEANVESPIMDVMLTYDPGALDGVSKTANRTRS